jgi:hypothetical protein
MRGPRLWSWGPEGLLGDAYLLSDCEGNRRDHGDEHGRENSEGE